MKRILMLIILLVLLAATINLAVALGFWWFGEHTPKKALDNISFGIRFVEPHEIAIWRDWRESTWPKDALTSSTQNYYGSTNRLLWQDVRDSSNPNNIIVDNYFINIVKFGWPMRCIAGVQKNEWHGTTTKGSIPNGLLLVFDFQWPERINRVLWLGMFINVLFYSAVIALAYFCLRYSRRAMMKKRGHCLKCAYDLRGDYYTGCPECGYGRELA